jgi:UDP-3-O-[3-hydroxymyristoyl] N-acetylglucosamine deacetylase
VISGYGLHSGAPSWVRLHRAEGTVRFRRAGVEIPARLEYVAETKRSTTLAHRGYGVTTAEHLLAALHIRGWWEGLVIEVSADEVPILDGSAAPWLGAVDDLGPPPPAPPGFVVSQPFAWRQGETRLRVTPGAPRLCAEIFFDHPAILQQRWCGGPEAFTELAGARTFGFLSDLEKLRAGGLATAASLDNAVVYGDEGPLAPLRMPDEPVRHKALDALGDLYLLGRPLVGALEVVRGSHGAHVHFARALLREAMLLSLLPSPAGEPGELP